MSRTPDGHTWYRFAKPRVFRVLVVVACTGAALATVEAATRFIDGYRLVPLRLEPSLSRLRAAESRHRSESQKWRGDTDAWPYVRQLPVAAGVDRDWFTAQVPDRPVPRPDADLDARAKRYPGGELPANYEWNWNAVVNGVCRGEYRNLVAFDRFEDLYVFNAIDGSDWPTFRFLQHATYPSGLVTNGFGWRGPDIAVNKPPHTIRLAFVGASTTVSPHAEPYSYPELAGFWLNKWAASRGLEVSIEVINAGREALTSRSFQAIVRQELVPVEPDLVVYYEGSNQFWPNDFLSTPVPRLSRTLGMIRGMVSYSALANRIIYVVRKSTESGSEPAKPRLTVNWPRDLDELDPNLHDPRLPIALPTILNDLEIIKRTLEENGGELVMTSFAWLVYPGMALDPARDADLFAYLNTTFWPFTYAHMRRFLDFQTRVFRKYASVNHLDFIDVASAYPRDPRLFDDAIHMTHAGIRLQAWITFNGLVPTIERQLASRQLPRPATHRLVTHPAFAGRRLVSKSDVRGTCTAASAQSPHK
jgi:hypothetical protein